VPLGEAAKDRLLLVVNTLRDNGIPADIAYGDRGLKGAMKAADRSGAVLAIVAGERDLDAGVAQVKDLRSGEQEAVPLDNVVEHIEKRLT